MEIRSVRFRQSGGFAGLVRGIEVAGDQLSASDRDALARELRAAPAPAPGPARDLIVYELEIETRTGVTRLEFDEASVPASLAPLVESLAARARPVPL